MDSNIPPMPDLRADCSACAALCCIVFAFEPSDEFAIHKPPLHPCPNLMAERTCAIHGEREARGFAGCLRYDCLGAGQIVTKMLMPDRAWPGDESLQRQAADCLRALREIHRLAELVEVAGKLALSSGAMAERAALLAALVPESEWTPQRLEAFEAGPLPGRVARFLRSLAKIAPADRAG